MLTVNKIAIPILKRSNYLASGIDGQGLPQEARAAVLKAEGMSYLLRSQ